MLKGLDFGYPKNNMYIYIQCSFINTYILHSPFIYSTVILATVIPSWVNGVL